MKTTRTTLVAVVLLLWIWVKPVLAQFPILPLKVSGFLGTVAPLGAQKDYDYWAVIEFTIRPRDAVGAFMQYDLSATYPREAHFIISTESRGAKLDFKVGKFLNSVFDPIPGQKGNPVTRGKLMMSGFTVWPVGFRGDIRYRGVTASATNHMDGERWILQGGTSAFVLFWQQGVGPGFFVNPSPDTAGIYLHPSAGITWQDNDPRAFFQNYTRLPVSKRDVRLYLQLDYDGLSERVYPLVGVTWIYGSNSFVKFYYDELIESARAELTFTF